MPLFRRLATLATAAEAARRYAKKNPEKASKYLDQAAAFVDKQTKGKYSGQINGAAQKAKSAAGIRQQALGYGASGYGPAGNGHNPAVASDLGEAATYEHPTTPAPPRRPSPGPSAN